MQERLCVLNIGAHPADIVDDAGGTCSHHADRGDRVVGVTLTRGARVHDRVLDELRTRTQVPAAAEMTQLLAERAAVKQREVEVAAAVIGIRELHFLEYAECFIRLHSETYRYLPVQELSRQRARETEADFFARRNRMWVHDLPVANGADSTAPEPAAG